MMLLFNWGSFVGFMLVSWGVDRCPHVTVISLLLKSNNGACVCTSIDALRFYNMLQPIYNLTPQQIFHCRSLTAASLATLLSQSPMRICLASPQRSKFAQELGWCSPRSCCLECAVAAVPEEKEVHAGLNLL